LFYVPFNAPIIEEAGDSFTHLVVAPTNSLGLMLTECSEARSDVPSRTNERSLVLSAP
jgi:hypothetical protein